MKIIGNLQIRKSDLLNYYTQEVTKYSERIEIRFNLIDKLRNTMDSFEHPFRTLKINYITISCASSLEYINFMRDLFNDSDDRYIINIDYTTIDPIATYISKQDTKHN